MSKDLLLMILFSTILIVTVYSSSDAADGAVESCPQIEVLRGRDGRDGRDGVKGEKGDPGNHTTGCQTESPSKQGSQGPPGIAGPRGPAGEEGLQGPQGEKGTRGDTGLQGPQGMSGMKGMKGDPGLRGPQGVMGLTGLQGQQGDNGMKGDLGSRGPQGGMGLRGPQGERGVIGMKGDPGLRGIQGERGPQGPRLGGAVYVRWGRTNCSDSIGTELVYSGRAGGTHRNHAGGAANYLCMPDDPDYLQYISGVTDENYVSPVEYGFSTMPTMSQYSSHNVPCAVCYVATRGTVLMIPAKTQCPTNWTREYYGYLMSSYHNHRRTMYECIDNDPESVPGLNASSRPRALFYTNEATCNGFSCPPYSSEKELTCVVCTR